MANERGPGEFDEPEDFEDKTEWEDIEREGPDGQQEHFRERFHRREHARQGSEEGEYVTDADRMFQEGGLLHGLDVDSPEFHKRIEGIEDERVRAEAQRLGVKAYSERTAREAEAREKAKRYSASSVRVESGVMDKPFEAHSKRLLHINIKRPSWAGGPLEPAANPSQVRSKVKTYNELRERHMNLLKDNGPGLEGADHARYIKLRNELGVGNPEEQGYRFVQQANEEALLPGEAEHKRIEEKLKDDYPETKVQGLRPLQPRTYNAREGKWEQKPEDIGSTVAAHGQEKKGSGWKETYDFNKEQLSRKYNALRTGEASLGWGTRGAGGFAVGQPVEKAKVTVGPNQDVLVKTGNWVPARDTKHIAHLEDQIKQLEDESTHVENPDAFNQQISFFKTKLSEKQNQYARGQDKFTASLPKNTERKETLEGDKFYTEGAQVQETIDNLGLGVKANHEEGNEWTFTTKAGEHLNPDQINALKEALHVNHGMSEDKFEVKSSIPFTRENKRVPVGYSKLPKGIKEEDVVPGTRRKNIYQTRLGAKLGERDPISGELLPDQTNTLGVRIGPRALQYHTTENTDAIGWGKSWRPGEKEISSLLFAGPEHRRKRELVEAYDESLNGNDDKMKSYLGKYHANDEQSQQGERKDEVSREARELKELAAAGSLSLYYSARKNYPKRAINYTFAHAKRVPKVGPHIEKWGNRQGTLISDAYFGYRDPLGRKLERAKLRAAHPLSAIRLNPETRKYETDPTVPGITNEGDINIPSIKYRTRPINNETYEIRQFERRLEKLKGIAQAREHVQKILTQEKKTGRVGEWFASRQGKTMLWNVYGTSTEGWQDTLNTLHKEIRAHLPQEGQKAADVEFQIKNKPYSLTDTPKLHAYLKKANQDIEGLLKKADTNPELYSRESLEAGLKGYAERHPGVAPDILKGAGRVGLGGALVVGGGVLAADRYQQYKKNKGHDINHPILKSVVPERIVWPKVGLKRTQSYVVPHNSITDALDIQGEKVPIAGRLSIKKEEKARLREHKDISGDRYGSNLPLLGGIGVTPPSKTKGSVSKAVLRPSPRSELGPTKNMYVAGKQLPVDVSFGKKERWDNKQHRLQARYNPYKLNQEDREHLVQLASETPGRDAQISAFYHGDQKLEDMRNDQDEVDRINRKNAYWLQGGKNKAAISDISGKRGVGVASHRSQTVEEATQQRGQFERRRRERNREERAR